MGDIITRGYLHCIDMYYNMHVYHHKHGITCENKNDNNNNRYRNSKLQKFKKKLLIN